MDEHGLIFHQHVRSHNASDWVLGRAVGSAEAPRRHIAQRGGTCLIGGGPCCYMSRSPRYCQKGEGKCCRREDRQHIFLPVEWQRGPEDGAQCSPEAKKTPTHVREGSYRSAGIDVNGILIGSDNGKESWGHRGWPWLAAPWTPAGSVLAERSRPTSCSHWEAGCMPPAGGVSRHFEKKNQSC